MLWESQKPKRRDQMEAEEVFKKIMTNNFPKLIKHINFKQNKYKISKPQAILKQQYQHLDSQRKLTCSTQKTNDKNYA